MEFRIGRDFNDEFISGLGTDKGHELVGVKKIPGLGHILGQIAAQRDHVADAELAVAVEQRANVRTRGAHAGDMWRGLLALRLYLLHRFISAFARAAARAEGDGKELGLQLRELLNGFAQLDPPFLVPGREKLKTEGARKFLLRVHGVSVGSGLCLVMAGSANPAISNGNGPAYTARPPAH